jgi:hypothetical protein
MRKTLLPVIFVCLSAICVSAQQDGPPPAAPDYSPDSWKEYSFAQDNIRFRFPAERKVSSEDKGHRYERSSFIDFSLTVSEAGIDVGKDKGKQQKYLILIALTSTRR